MRLLRMKNGIPDLCDDAGLFRENVFKICCTAASRIVPCEFERMAGKLVPGRERKFGAREGA
jgi:hypothetical protein